jgi:hypothetical protein
VHRHRAEPLDRTCEYAAGTRFFGRLIAALDPFARNAFAKFIDALGDAFAADIWCDSEAYRCETTERYVAAGDTWRMHRIGACTNVTEWRCR